MWSKIREELEKQGKSVYWLSKQTGISDNTIYAYKNHGIEPTFSKVWKIADALGVSLDDLREDKEWESGPERLLKRWKGKLHV